MVRLHYEMDRLRALLEAEQHRAEEIRQERDRWREQAQRLEVAPVDASSNGRWILYRQPLNPTEKPLPCD